MKINPFPKSEKEQHNALLQLAHIIGKRRFGSPCKHEQTRGGYCVTCLRRVIVK